MKLFALEGNSQMLDGGAMFGNAPKNLWAKWIEPDEFNRIKLASRSLLVIDDQGQKILFEVGVGDFFSPNLKQRYGIEGGGHKLLHALKEVGLHHEDISAIVLSHLHFDHAGGLFESYGSNSPDLLFPNAKMYVSSRHWARVCSPHYRDKASFLPDLNTKIMESGRLILVNEECSQDIFSWLKIHFSDGHTPGLMVSEINTPKGPLLFCSDLIPGNPWVHLPITMGYDRYPELLIEEKSTLLKELQKKNGFLFFTHDSKVITSRPYFDGKKWCGEPCLALKRVEQLSQNL